MRFVELALFLAPLAAYGVWRVSAADGQPGPSRAALIGMLLGLMALGAALAWFAGDSRDPPGSRYVPAELRDGRVVPGHAE